MSAAIEVEQLPEFLNGVVQQLQNPDASKAFEHWLPEFIGEVGRGFQSSQSPFGDGWAPLKHPRPAGHNPGSRPLIDTGDLELSLIGEGEGNITQITNDSLVYGTSIPYAGFHQHGTSNIPARPFLNVNEDQLSRLANDVAEQIIQSLA